MTRLPNVRYLTGFTGSTGQALLTDGGGVFFTDGRYEHQSAREVPDLDRVTYSGELAQSVAEAARRLGVTRVAFEGAGLTYSSYVDLAETEVELQPTSGEVERLRWAKEPPEVELLRAAQAVADEAFELIAAALSEGMTEHDAAFQLDTFLRGRSEGVAFDTIIAFGENAAEPHHRPTNRPLRRGDVVTMDYGCVMGGYHSDMTRTVAFGEPPGWLREIHGIVREAQQAGVDAVTAGASGGQVDRVVRDFIFASGYGEAYKHPLGHGVGLEIHEGPSLRPAGADVLPESSVVTVEPGVYLNGLGGVRIEDMVEVTSNGCWVIPRVTKDLVVL